eukprot:TRINITY_DN29547_c0_g1_i1.p1 TRINITY_DN29547_c0_g1~~TRINITY_DN29547_c0_g1_i1.p1  ORF type:complete len:546 (+),score=74.18 TRINITY_DN29547_c0_g1_i1:89-1726(+)
MRRGRRRRAVAWASGALALALALAPRQAGAATSASYVTAISPSSITTGHATSITLTGTFASGDLAIFTTSGNCGSVTPNVDISSGTASFTVTGVGSYVLCVRANGETDSVEQTNPALSVVAATSASHVSSVSPTTVSQNWPNTLTLTAGSSFASGDLGIWTTTGNCGSVTPNTAIHTGSATFNIASTGTYKLCVRANGGSDSVEQTGPSLTVISSSSSSQFSAINPTGSSAGTSTVITLTGIANAGDKAIFATNCATATPNVALTTGLNKQTSFTVSSAGTYKLCYRKNTGTDSIEQAGVAWTVHSAANRGDPVAVYGNVKRKFWLPVGEPWLLLRTPELQLFGATFAGDDRECDQWFGHFALKDAHGRELMRVDVKRDLLAFNRSTHRSGTFETMDVVLSGDQQLRTRMWTSEGADVQLQFGPLSMWKYPRLHCKLGYAEREVVYVQSPAIEFALITSEASEYCSGPKRVEFAHLDMMILSMRGEHSFSGVLPELWGVRPTSEEVEALTVPGVCTKERTGGQWRRCVNGGDPLWLKRGSAARLS